MEIKLYKLYNTETGKFNAGGDHWTKAGKCWNQKNHLTTALTSKCREKVSRMHHWDWQTSSRKLSDEEYKFYRDDANKEILYNDFIPETWVIIEITNNGARELCKAKDWLKHK